MTKNTLSILALIAFASWAVLATADWTEARCDIYPKGSDENNATAPFSTKDYDATTRLRCKAAGDKEYGNCAAGIARMDNRQASITVQSQLDKMRRDMAASGLTAADDLTPKEQAEVAAMRRGMARALIRQWKINKAPYEQYGGA